MDANSMRDYLQSRGISALSSSMPVLNPDDKLHHRQYVTPVSIKACPRVGSEVGRNA
jgi:hypothetical protein